MAPPASLVGTGSLALAMIVLKGSVTVRNGASISNGLGFVTAWPSVLRRCAVALGAVDGAGAETGTDVGGSAGDA